MKPSAGAIFIAPCFFLDRDQFAKTWRCICTSPDMKKVILKFPDPGSLVDFILTYRITDVETNASEYSLVARLKDTLIKTAVVRYGATYKPYVPVM